MRINAFMNAVAQLDYIRCIELGVALLNAGLGNGIALAAQPEPVSRPQVSTPQRTPQRSSGAAEVPPDV